jgi:hypothetical protein
MMKYAKIATLALALCLMVAGSAMATPSTQIWIPSTDIQAYKTLHLGIDNYVRTKKNMPAGTYSPDIYDAGITAGVLPFEKVQMEVGVDFIRYGVTAYDDNPVYFNTKLGTPENSFFAGQPAVAVGIYNVGTKGGDLAHNTQQDIAYGVVAKTLPVVGRLSAGGYLANSANVNFKDHLGNNDNSGVLLSWDRTMTEISDKLWMGVDYQGGNNAYGALNFGVSWAFSKNVSVILGYDIYNRKATGGQPTFTTQLDVNFP